MDDADFEKRCQQQIDQYRDTAAIHELPPIFHYWSNKYVRPMMNSVMEVDNVTDLFASHIYRAACATKGPYKIASLGAGDCSVEYDVAVRLRELGLAQFTVDCLELSPILLDRARADARYQENAAFLRLVECDLNQWSPERGTYVGVMANHSLHHMVELESIFQRVREAMHSSGVFVANDMIGRNGHMRWPETLRIVEGIWEFLPNRLKNYEDQMSDISYVNRDYSAQGFEGIRAQDILPLLVSSFDFSHFLGCGGIIDVFVERHYGHNFNIHDHKDCALIDFIQDLNDLGLQHGFIKPTMMFAVMVKSRAGETRQCLNLSPAKAVREATD